MVRNGNGWNLELMFDDDTRPKIFTKPTGQTRNRNGCNSYVYRITNRQNKKSTSVSKKKVTRLIFMVHHLPTKSSKNFSQVIQSSYSTTKSYVGVR